MQYMTTSPEPLPATDDFPAVSTVEDAQTQQADAAWRACCALAFGTESGDLRARSYAARARDLQEWVRAALGGF